MSYSVLPFGITGTSVALAVLAIVVVCSAIQVHPESGDYS